jgi:hypothetical protein
LPGKGMIPWIQPGTAVMKVKRSDGTEVDVGSFIAIQRAGGTCAALASGGVWHKRNEPIRAETGNGTIKNHHFDDQIETGGAPFARAALYSEGRGELTVGKGGRMHNYNQIYIT